MTFTSVNGGGWIATCECGWERYAGRRTDLSGRALDHTCAKPRTPKESPKPRPSADWSNREDSTWIDQL